MTYTNEKKYNNFEMESSLESKRSLQERFANPIIKVSVRGGVLVNRLQSLWNNENLHTWKKSAS